MVQSTVIYCGKVKSMIVKIGYIGSQHSTERAKQIAKTMANIELYTYTYTNPSDVPRLHQQAIEETDVLCFSGIIPYYYRERGISSNKPCMVTPFHEYMVVASLLACMLKYSVDIDEISIDLPDKQLLKEIEGDIGRKLEPHLVYDYRWIYDETDRKNFSFSEVASFHERLFQEGKTKVAITSIHYVYDELIRNDLPAIFMVDHERNTKSLLEKAKQRVLYDRLEDGMIAVVYISPKLTERFCEKDIERINALFQTNVQLMNKKLENQKKLVFYTTRGIIENWLNKEEYIDWIKVVEKEVGGPLNIGIGYGRHKFEAEENAEQALQSSKVTDTSNAYIVTEKKTQIGPMIGSVKQDVLRIYDEWLQSLTKQTKTNLNTLKRFITFMEIRDYQPFTVQELSSYSKVTVRTSERFIKRLYEAGVVIVYGKEQNQMKKGRPRNVYALRETIEFKFRQMNEKLKFASGRFQG